MAASGTWHFVGRAAQVYLLIHLLPLVLSRLDTLKAAECVRQPRLSPHAGIKPDVKLFAGVSRSGNAWNMRVVERNKLAFVNGCSVLLSIISHINGADDGEEHSHAR